MAGSSVWPSARSRRTIDNTGQGEEEGHRGYRKEQEEEKKKQRPLEHQCTPLDLGTTLIDDVGERGGPVPSNNGVAQRQWRWS